MSDIQNPNQEDDSDLDFLDSDPSILSPDASMSDEAIVSDYLGGDAKSLSSDSNGSESSKQKGSEIDEKRHIDFDLTNDDEVPNENLNSHDSSSSNKFKIMFILTMIIIVLGLGYFLVNRVLSSNAAYSSQIPRPASELTAQQEPSVDDALSSFTPSLNGPATPVANSPSYENVVDEHQPSSVNDLDETSVSQVFDSNGTASDQIDVVSNVNDTDMNHTFQNDLMITQGLPIEAEPVEFLHQDVPKGVPTLSEEESMYDKALLQLEKVDVPAEAIKIDRAVIQKKLASNQIERMKAEIDASRSEVGAIKDVVVGIQAQLSSMNDVLKTNSSSQNALVAQISELNAEIKKVNREQKINTENLRKEIAEAKSSANRHIEAVDSKINTNTVDARKKNTTVKQQSITVASKSKVSNSDIVAQATLKHEPKPVVGKSDSIQRISSPNTTSTHNQSTGNQNGFPEQCTGSRAVKSSNWRVKGITASSAYLLRSDGESVFVRLDTPVSGFGQVVAFDSSSSARTVCTTMGLITR